MRCDVKCEILLGLVGGVVSYFEVCNNMIGEIEKWFIYLLVVSVVCYLMVNIYCFR